MTLSIRDPETDRLVRLARARGPDPHLRRARPPVASIVDRSALVASVLGEPLLCTGNAFARTDVVPALASG